ncbi:MAG: Wzz/FepE/Etk N-terminal domain-containing protein [Bacteroidales bacterium]|nr:Wzz/FepE/Etk N-terminal domain-containing protein [Bacteroidales bacterium]
MEERYDEYYEEEEYNEIDIMALVRKLFSNWKKLLVWVGIAAVLGLIIGYSIPRTYTASAELAPEIVQKSSSSMSSLAALAGVNLNNMTVTDAMYPDLYPEIVNSVPFRIELFSMPVTLVEKKDTVKTDMYDYLLNYNKSPWWSSVIGFPFKVLGWVKNIGKEKEDEVSGHSEVDPYHLTLEQGKMVKALGESISIAVDKKTYLISIATTAQNPKVAADLCQLVVANLQKYVVNYRTEKSRHDLAYYQQLNEQAQKEYYDAQQRYARYVDANQGVVFQRVLIERERLQNEANLKYQVYNTTAQQVNNAKAKVQMETPVCAVIQPPTIPLKRAAPSKAKILVAFMFLGFCFGAVWYLWGKDLVAKLRGKDEEPETPTEA